MKTNPTLLRSLLALMTSLSLAPLAFGDDTLPVSHIRLNRMIEVTRDIPLTLENIPFKDSDTLNVGDYVKIIGGEWAGHAGKIVGINNPVLDILNSSLSHCYPKLTDVRHTDDTPIKNIASVNIQYAPAVTFQHGKKSETSCYFRATGYGLAGENHIPVAYPLVTYSFRDQSEVKNFVLSVHTEKKAEKTKSMDIICHYSRELPSLSDFKNAMASIGLLFTENTTEVQSTSKALE